MFEAGGVMERHWHKLRKTTQPFMDQMMVGASCDIIRRYQPDILFIHLAHLDHTRHANGIHGPAVNQAIIANDDWLGRLMEAAMDLSLIHIYSSQMGVGMSLSHSCLSMILSLIHI